MTVYEQQRFTGERALFMSRDVQLLYCTFADGESPLKESRNVQLSNCLFEWKYPLWYCDKVTVTNSILSEMARAGIWYTTNLVMQDMTVEAPKTFRRCENVELLRIALPNAQETLWNCKNVTLKQASAKGDYFAMGAENMQIEDFTLVGNYCFDGAKNLTIRNAKLLSKDAFWNCENVTVYDSLISGEYLGWNAKNVTFVGCTIASEQGMCYMDQVTLKDCRLLDTNLAFEYSTVDAQLTGSVDSIKNPISGKISAKRVGEVIFDDPHINPADTQLVMADLQADVLSDGFRQGS